MDRGKHHKAFTKDALQEFTLGALGWNEMGATTSPKEHGIDFAQYCMIMDMQVTHARRTAPIFLFGLMYFVQDFLYTLM